MLGTLRKFSSSIFAKIFLFIVAIPFVFWGMGPLFTSGSLNTIFKIGKEKVSTQEFVEYIKVYAPLEKTLDKNIIENLLSNFIGEKLFLEEIKNFKIRLSDNSLSSIIKSQKIFEKNKKFSRIEYEKFLVKNSLNATTFENRMSIQEKKKQMLDSIRGGIIPPYFLVSMSFNKINQKRNVQIVNLNDLFNKKINISDDQIKNYYEKNKNSYKKIYKSIKFIKLHPKNLTEENEFNDLFFKKIDEIDDLIIEGKNIDYILKKYNLEQAKILTLDKHGKDKNLNLNNNFPPELIESIFNTSVSDPTILISQNDEYFVLELTNTENILRTIDDESIYKEIKLILEENSKRKLISELIAKINKNDFNKLDFDKLSKDENLLVKKIRIENSNDDKELKKELINQIYTFPAKKVIIATDINFSENFLVYVDTIEEGSIDEQSENYEKYIDLSKTQVVNSVFNTYDSYLKKKYKVDINYKALESITNSFIKLKVN